MYPSLEAVNSAGHMQICRWYRFLPSPGMSAIGKENFHAILDQEAPIMNRIVERLKELGGFTPEISKAIGWE